MQDYKIPGLVLRDIEIAVPLDWSDPEGETITLFAREVTAASHQGQDLPLLAFLQGGPGGKSPRPVGTGPAWLGQALRHFRVVLIDQRGTGRSSALEGAAIARFSTPEAGATYLSRFRADSIIRDCEHLRKTVYEGRKWSTLGQSYGGFLTLSYLSMAPEGLSACYVTGGLAGLQADAATVYRHTYPRVAAKCARHYARYPQDRDTMARIADLLEAEHIRLPDGDRLTAHRLQTLGMGFGMAPGFEEVHWLLDEAFEQAPKTATGAARLRDSFLFQVMAETGFATNPLYAVLQEVIYGAPGQASHWAAERVRAEFPAFDPAARPLLFTGEMIYPWMFDEIRALRPFQAATEALHRLELPAPLYDPQRLAANEVPVAAAIYFDDMYVDATLSLDTAARVGNLRRWVTSSYEHDGLRQSPRVLARLIEMAEGPA